MTSGATMQEPRPSAPRRGLDTLAGFMSGAAIFLGSLVAIALDPVIDGVEFSFAPVRLGVAAIALSLVAAGISAHHERLARFAVFYSTGCFVLGMIIAVITDHPVF